MNNVPAQESLSLDNWIAFDEFLVGKDWINQTENNYPFKQFLDG